LIAYFIGNISAKKYQNACVSRLQQAKGGTFFETRCTSLSPCNFTPDLNNFTSCTDALHVLFCANGMALNRDKSEAILLGTGQPAHSYSNLTIDNVAASEIPLADHIKILGLTLYKNLSMSISSIIKSVHYHVCALRHIRSSISQVQMWLKCALAGSRLNSTMHRRHCQENIL